MEDIKKVAVAFVIGLAVGLWVGATYFPKVVEKEVVPISEVTTAVTLTDHTKVGYVPKVSNEATDVEVKKALPVVTVKVNDKVTEMPLVQGETQKFEKGKVVVDQSTKLSVDVTAQVEKQVADGIASAFAKQENKVSYKVGLEGSIDSDGKMQGDLRISRQAKAFDIDARVNKDKQSVAATWWFK